MKIEPISCNYLTTKGKLKIPESSRIINQEKMSNIGAYKLAQVFDDFESAFRDTIKTFIYRVKNIG